MKTKNNNELIELLFSHIANSLFYSTNEPLSQLKFKFADIRQILEKENKFNSIKLLYFLRKTIHTTLYKEDEIIFIQNDNNNKEIGYYFYLDLLINENPVIIDYSYSIEFLEKANNERRQIKDKYQKIILAKVIIDLIYYFKGTDEYNEEEDKDTLGQIEEDNRQEIKNCKNVFHSIGLIFDEKEIEIKKIDELYLEVINALIKQRKIEDFGYTYNILNQLELMNINLTNNMLNGIRQLFTSYGKNLNNYIIANIGDLLDETKIKFYYILLKYILKDTIYYYQFPFLIELKKFILEAFKNIPFKKLIIFKEKKTIMDKFEYIIKAILDSDYYWKIYLDKKFLELKEIQEYYKNYLFESKKKEIYIIGQKIKENDNDFELYLQDYELAKSMNLRYPIINYLYIMNNKGINKTEEKFNNEIKNWEEIEKMIKDHKIKKFIKINRNIMLNYFLDKNNKEILLKVFNLNDYEFFIKQAGQKVKDLDEKLISENKVRINETIRPEKENQKNEIETPKDDNQEIKYENNLNIKLNEKNNIIIIPRNQEKHKSTQYNIIETKKYEKQLLDFDAPSLFENDSKNDAIIFNFLNKCTILFHVNPNKKMSFIYDNIYYGEHNIRIEFEQLMRYKSAYIKIKEENEISKNFILFLDFLNQIENEIKKEFLYNYNLKIKIETNKEQINNNDDPSIYNISCLYTYYEPFENNIKLYREENILINKTNSNLQGFQFMIYNINSIYIKMEYNELSTNYQINQMNSKNKNIKESNLKKDDDIYKNENNKEKKYYHKKKPKLLDDYTQMKSFLENPLFTKIADIYKIIEFQKIIGKHNGAAEFIIELSNGYYLSGGCEKTLILYDNQFMEKTKIKDINDWAFNVIEKGRYNKKTNKIELLCCTHEEIRLIYLDTELFRTDIQQYELPKKTTTNSIEMKENNYIMIGLGGCSYFIDLFNKNGHLTEYKITDKTYRGAIKISDKIVALSSNIIIPNGENKLIFYNIKSKKISNEISGYSFTISNNNLALMSREDINKNNQILLCACKKYTNNQKNGILLINPNLADNKKIENEFFETNEFEVYCFCQILKIENKNMNFEDIDEEYKKGINIIKTDYFFVGGFDIEKREGKIKLFKVVYGEKIWKTKIEYIQDIVFEENQNFEEFEGPISCIYQSKITGHIMVTSYSGNAYLFTHPNLSFYLN